MNCRAQCVNKSLLTNMATLLVIALGVMLHNLQLRTVGYYALSGAVTNWLAVYMLFERVPLLYGSGVIPSRFEEFKSGIKHLIMEQFFTEEHVSRFLQDSSNTFDAAALAPVLDEIDYDTMFHGLVEAIMESNLGSMLSMVGGPPVLDALRDPFKVKMQRLLNDVIESPNVQNALAERGALLQWQPVVEKVEAIVDARLAELTPEMVKVIIQTMIREHLGWLVVWGGVFGGLIGLCFSF